MLIDLGQQDPEANLIELCYIMNDALNLCASAEIEDRRAMSEIFYSIKNILIDLNALLGRNRKKFNGENLTNIDKIAS